MCLTLDNKGITVSSYDCKSVIFMLSDAILLINSNKFCVKMLKWSGEKIIHLLKESSINSYFTWRKSCGTIYVTSGMHKNGIIHGRNSQKILN